MRRAWISNTLWNVLGMGLPFVAAILLTPFVVRSLGPNRYGLLVLAWTIVGYFSVFDFGLGRAITQVVARTHSRSVDESSKVVAVGIILLGGMGLLGGLLLFAGAAPITSSMRVPPSLHEETVRCVRILGIGLPAVIVSAGFRGALEGIFDFPGTNVIRLVTGIGTYAMPALMIRYSSRLDLVCGALVLLRVATSVAYLARVRTFFSWRMRVGFDPVLARNLLGYGGWITVSNLVSPLMAYLDRFLIAGALPLGLVGYYTTSQEVVTKFQVVPGAILSVVFPAISGAHEKSPATAGELFLGGSRAVTFSLLPLAAASVAFAREGLQIWLGAEFADGAYQTAQVLAIGSFVNCLALNPFLFLQAIGRPDITAKAHLIELPIYFAMLWLFMTQFGLIGVAIAWSARMALDLLLLLFASTRCGSSMQRPMRAAGTLYAAGAIALVPLMFVPTVSGKVAGLAFVSVVSGWMAWGEWRRHVAWAR